MAEMTSLYPCEPYIIYFCKICTAIKVTIVICGISQKVTIVICVHKNVSHEMNSYPYDN